MTAAPAHDPELRRPDVEGLRAVAVLAVLLHHAWPAALPGGFAGVDVFFVISGYLIAGLLVREPPSSPAAWAAFWSRRVRRILPALVLVVGVTWMACGLFMTSREYEALSRQVAAAAVFANNLLLAGEAGYFAPAAASQPLLHLWSLAVEEQFYLLLPLVVALGLGLEHRPVAWIVRLGAASLIGLLLFGQTHDVAAFYGLHLRFWELAAGAGLAMWQAQAAAPTAPGRAVAAPRWVDRREWRLWCMLLAAVAALQAADLALQSASSFAIAGSLLVLLLALSTWDGPGHPGPVHRLRAGLPIAGLLGLAAALAGSPADAWPGPATALPVVSTLCLLAGSPSGPVARALSVRPAVAVGGISYPLYLWHWPLLVAAQLWFGDRSVALTAGVLTLSFALAWATRHAIEDPIRFGRLARTGRHRVPIGVPLVGLAVVGLLGLWGWLGRGLPERLPPSLATLEAWTDTQGYQAWRLGRCFHFLNNQGAYAAECSPPREPGRLRVLLWGDSHAAHLYPGLQAAAAREGFVLMQWTTGSCPPTRLPLLGEGSACSAKRAWAWRELAREQPDVVILGGAWALYAQYQAHQPITDAVHDSVEALRAMGLPRVLVFGPGPTWGSSLQADLLRHVLARRDQVSIPLWLEPAGGRAGELDQQLAARSTQAGARYVSITRELCAEAGCRTLGDPGLVPPDLLFFDRDHFSVSGSRILIEPLARQLLVWP